MILFMNCVHVLKQCILVKMNLDCVIKSLHVNYDIIFYLLSGEIALFLLILASDTKFLFFSSSYFLQLSEIQIYVIQGQQKNAQKKALLHKTEQP